MMYIRIGEIDIRVLNGYSTPFLGSYAREMAAFEIFEFLLSEKQNCGMLFECPSPLQETAMARAFPQVPTDSRPLRLAKRRADELRRRLANAPPMNEGGKFSASQSFENSENAERISPQGGARPPHSRLRSRACPEMAPQPLEKIESAPGNGMGSEASNPQDVVHRRTAGPCPIGSLSPGARPAKQRRWRRFIAPTNEEENFPPRKALKSHKTRKSTREGSLPELAASSRSFLAPAAPSAATMGTP